ncbi:MAG: hypothetical protein L0177_09460 [Chloroflexi bacterium]|nr:hypothetical protein [Chloroflexota bacterium]
MYGTIFRMKPKQGQEQKIIELFEEWERTRKPKVKGAVAGFLMRPDKMAGELVGVAIFSDKASYDANADDPEQDKWYRRLRDLLQADPTWEDGEYVAGGMG